VRVRELCESWHLHLCCCSALLQLLVLLLQEVVVTLSGQVPDVRTCITPVADSAVLQAHGVDAAAVRVLGPQQFLLPGFIDTHAHAPQYQVRAGFKYI
jgi:cytosine/adenosine deaminase-related metal-dependent hydrolase